MPLWPRRRIGVRPTPHRGEIKKRGTRGADSGRRSSCNLRVCEFEDEWGKQMMRVYHLYIINIRNSNSVSTINKCSVGKTPECML